MTKATALKKLLLRIQVLEDEARLLCNSVDALVRNAEDLGRREKGHDGYAVGYDALNEVESRAEDLREILESG